MAYQMKSREKFRWGKERRREKKKKKKRREMRGRGERCKSQGEKGKKKRGREKSSLGQCVGPIKRLKYLSDENWK